MTASERPERPLLVIGAFGQLGTALREGAGDAVVALSHAAFDITSGDIAAALESVRPRAVVNCAAFHNVDRCEIAAETAFAVNALAVDRIAAACARFGSTFVTVSSDYVFAGTAERPYTEHDVAAPRTVYGASKLAGESLALRHPGSIVVRASGLFGTVGFSSKGTTLIDKVLGQAARGEPTTMVADMIFSPSYAPHVARAIRDLIDRNAFGLHHVTNGGHCSWYDFVRTAFEKAGLGDAPLQRQSYAALANPTQRPMYSPLRNTTFADAGIEPLPAWEDALDEFLRARGSDASGRTQPALTSSRI